MSSQRILVSGGLAAGGVQTHLSVLCEVLRNASADVTIASVATNWPKDALASLRAHGVRVVVSPFGFGRGALLGKATAFTTWPFRLGNRYDTLYCIGEGRMHSWASRFVAPSGWRLYHEIANTPRPEGIVARLIEKMDGVLANSGEVERSIAAQCPSVPVRRIPFFTSRTALMPPSPRAAVAADAPMRVVYLGRIVEHKRPFHLVECWSEITREGALAGATLDLYGDDHDGIGIPRIRHLIAQAGMGNTVRVHGPYLHESLEHILSKADMVVLPSIHEGLPLVLVEAMSRGVPIVATSAGGTADLGEDNPDVCIAPGTAWEDFAIALRTMAARLRGGNVDALRLYRWTEARYGFDRVSELWREALLEPSVFFGRAPAPAMERRQA